MSLPDDTIASPLNLLNDEEQAREVLLLSFTLNLEFWERYALSVARGLGARVTVVGDAAMVQGEPAHVRYAGITYLAGLAACVSGGAFHPKLLVIADDDYATVAIGSGNATLSGWHDNAELWTVLRGDSEGAPDTFAALAVWLRALSGRVRFSGGVDQSLNRVATLLEGLRGTDPGPRLLTSLEQPIIDQLPAVVGAEELIVASPFYDRAGDALRVLFERFEPRSTRLLLQPADLVADGGALAGLLTARGEQAETIADDRYYHGKLVEWVTDGHRFALTGSPNVSSPALRHTLADTGNCELALLSEIDESLAPPSGGRITHEELASIAFDSRYDAPPAITLLGVMLGPDRVAVTLARPLSEAAMLEFARGATWEAAGAVHAGSEVVEIMVVLAAGSAVRIRLGSIVSNVCFVADPARFTRTRVEHIGRVRTNEDDIFRDASIADAFAHDLAELRQLLIQPPTQGGSGGGGGAGGPVSFTSWEEYLDACEALIGERLLAYGLALPALGSGEGRREEVDAGTLDQSEGDEEGVEVDSSLDPDPDDAFPSPRFDDLSAHQQRRYQRFCERLAAMSPQLPYAGRLVALRLILDATRGELFPGREQWLPLVAESTRALGVVTEGFDEERVKAASLAAVALAAMRGTFRRYAEWEDLRFPYEDAADAVTPLLEHADADAIERYAAPLEEFFGPAVQPAAVEALIESLLEPDLIGNAARLAEEEFGLSVERRGNVIELNDGIAGDPRRTLFSVISLCEKAEVVVTTPSWDAHRATAIWRKPELVIITRNATGERGALYELRGFGPGAYKDDIQSLGNPKEQWTVGNEVPERAAALMETVAWGWV